MESGRIDLSTFVATRAALVETADSFPAGSPRDLLQIARAGTVFSDQRFHWFLNPQLQLS